MTKQEGKQLTFLKKPAAYLQAAGFLLSCEEMT